MNKTILNLMVASLLLIFVAGCGGGGGGDSVSSDSTTQNLVPTDPNSDLTDQNHPPVADAGQYQALSEEDTTIQLDGSQSFDPDGDPITYAWTITDKPPSSHAVLNDPTAVKPTFVADLLGTYYIELIVTDSQGWDSWDEVVVSSENLAPVADAGGNQIVLVEDTVNLDGSGSFDVNPDDQLTYRWEMVSKPEGSLTELFGSDTVNPNFIPDTEGLYTISLVVNDGSLDSDPSDITIYAIDAENIDDFITALMNAVMAINNDLDDSDFNNANNRNSLTSKIIVIVENYLKIGSIESNKLTSDIASHMDGCTLGGKPDGNDWIMNCTAQEKVYPLIMDAIAILESMS